MDEKNITGFSTELILACSQQEFLILWLSVLTLGSVTFVNGLGGLTDLPLTYQVRNQEKKKWNRSKLLLILIKAHVTFAH